MINKREKEILEKDIQDTVAIIDKRVHALIQEKKDIIKGLPKKLQVLF